jgi:hypothetical protein
MRIKYTFLFIFLCTIFFAQNQSFTVHMCQTSEAMKELYSSHPEAKKEAEELQKFTASFKKNSAADCYVIPVVFHVYGTTQSGLSVTNSKIIAALGKLNDDFHGQNSDHNTVHNSFASIKAGMPDITFALAQFDPNGNPSTGIVYYPATSGYGNSSGYDAQIAADAWDNYRYMNVYIQNDLYANSVYNNSGIAWYPNTFMSNNNTARVVYNGAYLGTNTNQEFASTLTHEFAHWLNLIHTFEGGCAGANDYVNDTPSSDFGGASYTCHASPTSTDPVSCGHLVNAENYMDYSGAGGCYKMFTTEQTWRIYAALQGSTRFPLWQPDNVIAAGLWSLCSPALVAELNVQGKNFHVFPVPTKSKVHIQSLQNSTNFSIAVFDICWNEVKTTLVFSEKGEIDLSSFEAGIYFLKINVAGEKTTCVRVIKED